MNIYKIFITLFVLMVVTMPAVDAHANGDHNDKGQSSNSYVSDQRDNHLNNEDKGVSHSKDYRTSKESRNRRDSKKWDKHVPDEPVIPDEPEVIPVEPEDPVIPDEPEVIPVEPEDPVIPDEPEVIPDDPADNNPNMKNVILQMSATLENSDTELQYNYAENIGDGRGITFGCIGFCTGTYDGNILIKYYTTLNPDNTLAKYIPALNKIDSGKHSAARGEGNPSLTGLDGFIKDVNNCNDPLFKQAQIEMLDELYYNPAMEIADSIGAKNALTRAFIYDMCVRHGPDGAKSLVKSAGAIGSDENAYLTKLISLRDAKLKKEGLGDVKRDVGFKNVLSSGNVGLATPFKFVAYGDSFTIDGNLDIGSSPVITPTPVITPPPIIPPNPEPTPVIPPTPEPTPIITPTPEFTTVNPHEGNTWWVGADDQRIALINSNQAKDPTYAQLVAFIQKDTTDQNRYTSTYQCGDFAETFHNNAEKAGIKAAWVSLDGINHACNAVLTSDEGLVFVDCTGTSSGGGCYDTTVSVNVGSPYKRVSLFCSGGSFGSMGTVNDYTIYW